MKNLWIIKILWQQYIQRIESLSPESKVSRFYKEAGFMRVVWGWTISRDWGHWKLETISFSGLSRIDSSSRRSNFRSERLDSRKHENWACIGSHDQFFDTLKYGIEIRIWSVNQDNSQSKVRIFYGTMKYVVESIQDNTEIPVDPQEQLPQTSIKGCCSQIKGQKQNHNREYSLVQQQPYQCTKEGGLTLSHQNEILLRTISRRKW